MAHVVVVRLSICPGRMGSSGWVRSRAWIWLFSSTQRTMALCGGSPPGRRPPRADLAKAIIDRVLARGRLLELRGQLPHPHIKPPPLEAHRGAARVSGKEVPKFPEPNSPRSGPSGLDATRVTSATSSLLWIRLLCPLRPDPEEFAAFATDPGTRIVPLAALEKRAREALATPVRLLPGRFPLFDRHACREEDWRPDPRGVPAAVGFREKALVAATGVCRKEIQRATRRCFGQWPGRILTAWRRAVRRRRREGMVGGGGPGLAGLRKDLHTAEGDPAGTGMRESGTLSHLVRGGGWPPRCRSCHPPRPWPQVNGTGGR